MFTLALGNGAPAKAVLTAEAEAWKGTICALRTLSASEVRNCRPAELFFPKIEKFRRQRAGLPGVNFPAKMHGGERPEKPPEKIFIWVYKKVEDLWTLLSYPKKLETGFWRRTRRIGTNPNK